MNNPADAVHRTCVPQIVLQFGSIYYKHIKSVAEHMPLNHRRISLLATLFSISAALIEINDLSETPVRLEDVVTRVLDTLFRGQRDEVVKCLKAMSRADLVKISAEKKQVFHKSTCSFSDRYLTIMQNYTEEMCSSVTNIDLNLSSHQWIPMAQAMFDYFVFRYMPEWYLFLRRVLRASGLPEESKEPLYDEIFSSTLTWTAVNQYLAWAHDRTMEERTRLAFRDHLKKNSYAINLDPTRTVTHLTKIGVCKIANNLLLIHPEIADVVSEFENSTLHDYESFADTVHAMAEQFRPQRSSPRLAAT